MKGKGSKDGSPDLFKVLKSRKQIRHYSSDTSESRYYTSEADDYDLRVGSKTLASSIYANHLKKLAALDLLESIDLKVTLRALNLSLIERAGPDPHKLQTPEGEVIVGKRLGGGNNGSVYAASFLGDSGNWVVKVIDFNSKRNPLNERNLMKLVIERNLLRRDQQDARLFFDKAKNQAYLLLPKARGMEAADVFKELLATASSNTIEPSERTAAICRAFKLLEVILMRFDEFHARTGHVHGDAHMGNVFVAAGTKEHPEYDVTLIDYGGCCPIGITTNEYMTLFSPLGFGHVFTPPELPTLSGTPKEETKYEGTIDEKADLHTVMGNFAFSFIMGLLEDDANKCIAGIDGTRTGDLIQEFLTWILSACCNSDRLINGFGSESTAAIEAKKQRNEKLQELGFKTDGKFVNALPARVSIIQARAMVKLFIEDLEEECHRDDMEGTARKNPM